MWPMSQSYSFFECINSSCTNLDTFKLFRYHSDCHSQTYQLVLIFFFELSLRLYYLPSMDSPRIKKNQITSFTLHQHSLSSKGIIKFQLHPITLAIFDPRISLNYFILCSIVVSLRYYLQTANIICTYFYQRDHTLYTMKTTFVVRVLIHMQILDERVPS